MQKKNLYGVILLFFLIIGCTTNTESTNTKVLATIHNESITEKDFIDFNRTIPGMYKEVMNLTDKQILDQLINERTLLQEIKRNDVRKSEP